MPPFPSFVVFGKVFNSSGTVISNAQLSIKTSISTITKFTDSLGLFVYDLAEAGYVEGETVTVNVTEPFNNEIQTQTYVVEGSFLEENITTELRTRVEQISALQLQNVLHSVGKKPITGDNPLPIINKTRLTDEYELSGGDDDNRIYGYIDKDGAWYIQKFDESDKTYKYARGSSDFESNWTNRASLTYQFYNEVFG